MVHQLVLKITWHQTCNSPLPDPMKNNQLPHICGTRPKRVKPLLDEIETYKGQTDHLAPQAWEAAATRLLILHISLVVHSNSLTSRLNQGTDIWCRPHCLKLWDVTNCPYLNFNSQWSPDLETQGPSISTAMALVPFAWHNPSRPIW